jgi:NADP-dependent 3-hydroxy acid dehydrogenase YdfG
MRKTIFITGASAGIGKATHIHNRLIEKAKEILFISDLIISQIAY